jgi:MoxR-like ATPase
LKNIAHLLDVVDEVRDHVALGLMSDPGLSKTAQVKQWAEQKGRRYCELIISQRMPSEISGMPMPVNETRTMEVFDFDTLLTLKDGDVLAFDEFTNGNIQTLNACLTLIQERTMLSGKKLPSLVIVAMGNPQGKCDLLPQTKQRFWWVDVKWDSNTWIDYMQRTWNFTPHSKLIKMIGNQYQDGFNDQTRYNYYTPRTVENLLRIAMKIELDDPFWDASDIESDTVEALYDSLKNIDRFRIIQNRLVDWVQGRTADSWSDMVVLGIKGCESMGDLRRYISVLEAGDTAPALVDYMKSSGEDDE